MLRQAFRASVGNGRPRNPGWVSRFRLLWWLGCLAWCVCGCLGPRPLLPPDHWVDQARPSSRDTARLLRNAHYFKLMGRPELALKELEEACQNNPGDLQLVDALAQCYEEVGEWERTRQLYQEALSRRPGHPALTNNLCYSYYLSGNWPQAEACFRQALKERPPHEQVRNNLGLLLCRQGRREEARQLWREAGGESLAQEKLGQALTALGMTPPPHYAQEAPGESPGSGSAPAPPAPAPAPIKTAAVPGAATDSDSPAGEPVASASPSGPADAAIKVINGNGAPRMAHQTRSRLTQEGFQVVGIANHEHFHQDRTTIHYCPGADKVANILKKDFFPAATLKLEAKVAENIDIKVILGRELLAPRPHLAQLAE